MAKKVNKIDKKKTEGRRGEWVEIGSVCVRACVLLDETVALTSTSFSDPLFSTHNSSS
jgi:hypothetical protein